MLLQKLEQQIKNQGGHISFSDFMATVLYTPELGYYSGHHKKFGREGDFITAPEVSPLFSQCIARQCQEVLGRKTEDGRHSVEDRPVIILELGAGLGTMAADILLYLEQHNALPDYYDIVDISPWLREQQRLHLQEKCPHLLDKVRWLTAPPTAPFNGIILGNEVLDALPVHRFKIENGVLQELGVSEDRGRKTEDGKSLEEKFHSCGMPPSHDFKTAVARICPQQNYTSEINLDLPAFLRAHTQALQSGVVLFIDYGYPQKEYYHETRGIGTLRCHYQHQAHEDPFIHLGAQDITAHVNFTALAEAAVDQGFELAGYTTQAVFLINCGLAHSTDPVIQAKIRRLTHPLLMGEHFKAIAFSKNYSKKLAGFALGNLCHLL